MDLKLAKEKVAIVGCSSCKTEAPFGDDSWEFWGVNNLFLHLPDKKFDKWFEIHPIQKVGDQYHRRWGADFRGQSVTDYVKGLSKLNCPVLMQQKWDDVPNSVEYPINDVINKFGGYFTNTVSYMLALAIHLGAKEIGIWGVDMAVDTEYHHQRPSCEYFIGIAVGLGIKVTIPDTSDLLKTLFLYAWQEKENDAWTKKLKMIDKNLGRQITEAQQQIAYWTKKLEQGVGAKAANVEMRKIWETPRGTE